jgi:hypothetical protein
MSKRIRWAGHVVQIVDNRNAYRALMGKTEGIRPLGRQKYRWRII